MIDNKGLNSFEYFAVMDGDTDNLDMAKHLSSRAVENCVNLGTVQIKGLQDFVWWIHNHQTHNKPLIVDEFGQVAKMAAISGKGIEK